MAVLSSEQFERKVGMATLAAEELVDYATRTLARKNLYIGTKGSDLIEVVAMILHAHLYPIVDKKLNLVIGVPAANHSVVLGLLQDYHVAQEKITVSDEEAVHNNDTYIRSGRGYFISSTRWERRHSITMSDAYKQDRFDKDLFMLYSHDII